MSDQPPAQVKQKRNPVTHQAHRQEVFWQITFPLLVGLGLVFTAVGGVLWTGIAGTGEVDKWASVSLIWLIVPIMLLLFLLLVVLVALVYVLTLGLKRIPLFMYRVQEFFRLINLRFKRIADSGVEPVLRVRSFVASWRALWRR